MKKALAPMSIQNNTSVPLSKYDIEEQNFSILGKSNKLKGDFIFRGVVRIFSEIEGTIQVDEDGQLFFEKDSIIDADVQGGHIEISGIFKGKIKASKTTVLTSSCQFTGEIESKDLVIQPGAIVNMKATAN